MLRLILVMVLLLIGADAWAGDERDKAEAIGRDALALYNEERFVEAYDKFRKAESTMHSPVFAVYMARCQRHLGRLLRARKLYERVVSEALDDDAPPTWTKAQTDADEELAELARDIPTLTIRVTGGDNPRVWLDEKRLSPARLGKPIELDPGTHEVKVQQALQPVIRRRIRLVKGQKNATIVIRIQTTAPVGLLPAPDPEPERDNGLIAGGAVIMGVGALSLLIGIVTGVVALAQSSTDRITGSNDGETTGYVAIGLLAGGAAFIAGGVPMLVIGIKGDDPAPPPATATVVTLKF